MTTMPSVLCPCLLAGALLAAATTLAAADEDRRGAFAAELLSALEYRLVGPYRGGRVTAVAGIPEQPFTFYMGSTGGGVWKTTNAGTSWTNVSDGFLEVGSVGAIAVAPGDPNVVYVGTGSACPRGNISVGNGIYRSTDAGRTFTHLGLEEAGLIGRIAVDPRDPDRVLVAVLGHVFGPNEERGVYRSSDGGASWERVLFVSEQTGAVELAMNPSNPRELYAALWRVERKPWTLVDGGEESGLYKSIDGGDSWQRLAGGLPEGELGRIGVTVSPRRPERVWALVTAAEGRGGLYRSDDSGASWTRTSADRQLQTRGWYYSHVVAAPDDEHTVWVLNVRLHRSIDGGKSFTRVDTPHGDNHDLWINPRQPSIMIEGNDGGANVTLDGGATWSTLLNQPTAELYRVSVDSQFPYRIYGAQQDNTTISVPAWRGSSLTPQQDWYAVAGGESGHIAVHPEDPSLVYAGSYIGRIDRYDHRTGLSRNVILYPEMQDGTAPRDLEHRFQWNAPILISRHDPEVVYHASNFVHRSRDRGMSWETISPDLTRNDAEKQELPGGPVQHDHTGVEVFGTIFAFAESPHAAGELWAGSDDGRVHLSRDGGATWTDATPELMPFDGTVNSIELSSHRPGRAYLAVHRYRLDDVAPYLLRTDDWGGNWRLLTDAGAGPGGIPADHPTRVVREDPEREGLLYAGTERGMFVSFDGGEGWQSLQLNLPRTPITDLAVHRQDLVVATQGRSFWILDDLTPLHQLQEEVARAPAWLFEPRPGYLTPRQRRFRGAGPAPEPPPDGALLYYALAEEPEEGEAVELEILDGEGERLSSFSSLEPEEEEDDGEEEEEEDGSSDEWPKVGSLPAEKGLNRVVWDLRGPGPRLVKGAVMSLADTAGPFVPPGSYRVRLRVGEWTNERELAVLADPRLTESSLGGVTQEDLEAQWALAVRARDRLSEAHDRIRSLRDVRHQIEAVAERAGRSGLGEESRQRLEDAAAAIVGRLGGLEEELIQTRNEAPQDPLNFPSKLDDQLAYLYSHVKSGYGRPAEGAYRRFADLDAEIAPLLERLDRILDDELAVLNDLMDDLGVAGILP